MTTKDRATETTLTINSDLALRAICLRQAAEYEEDSWLKSAMKRHADRLERLTENGGRGEKAG